MLVAGLILAFYWQPIVISGILQLEDGVQGNLTTGALSGKMTANSQAALERMVDSVSKLLR
ncbi:hypothetical protein UF75_3057 [Desulfosporosinus sp. I2]|uniref:hypothetical protein n=1 Tax=Desulfosporosinus sp. I2 TaxID=1617025 RepID=UPI00061F7300|nr:hypothetical protein UF75_3057 [Desulfosporosinus sp. I2]